MTATANSNEEDERTELSPSLADGESGHQSGHRSAISSLARSEAIPALWLERLLVFSLGQTTESSAHDLSERFADILVDTLPDVAIAVFVQSQQGGDTWMVRRNPSPETLGSPLHPTRLFPDYAFEVLSPVEAGSLIGSVHLAWTAKQSSEELYQAFGDKAAALLALHLEHLERVRRAQMEIERLRAFEANALESSKLASLGQFAAGVVHDLSSPLSSIVGYADYLIHKASQRTDPPDPDDFDRLRRISDSATRMLRFARNIVAYVRPSSELRMAYALHLITDDALSFCEEEIRQVGARVVRDYAAGHILVRCAPEQLTQAVVNLINNACHSMTPGDAVLRLSLRLDGNGRALLAVEDSGCGIAADVIPRIFAPFFTTKPAGKGTGLGLSIVKRIVEEHGGAVRVEPAQEKGTRFVLSLPVDSPG